jgi:hypothetical protein
MEARGLNKALRNTGVHLLPLVGYTAQCEQQNKAREELFDSTYPV